MTLDDFISKHDGKFLEVAGSQNALDQCVDLANGYIRDVLELPIIEWTNAKDFPSNASKKDGVPQKGDLVIWGGSIAGHIAIFLEGNANNFTSFDQNFPLGTPCHKQAHNYNNVLGWLRPKKVIMTDQKCYPISKANDLEIDSNNWTFLRNKYDISDPAQIVGKVEELQNQVKEEAGKVSERESEIAKLEPVVNEMRKIKEMGYPTNALDLDTYIRKIKEEIAVIPSSNPEDTVPEDKPNTSNPNEETSVKINLWKKLIELINKVLGKL